MDTKTADSHAHHPRVEDDYLLRGNGRFVADAAEPGQATAAFVRSPHAHARIRGINIDAARKVRGVIAIVTAADIDAAGVGSVTRHPPLPGRGGSKLVMPHRHALARERVMYVGETVAMVIAETEFAAQDAADLVEVDYEPLDPVVTMAAAQKTGAPQLWPEAPGNLALDWAGTHPNPDANAAEVERIIASAKHVARVTVTQQRLTHATMETRGATAGYDAASDSYRLRVCSQSAGAMRDNTIAVMNVPKEKLRVITEDVGGAFGMKTGAYPEYIAQLVGAKLAKRPVHWMASRSESFLNDAHARDTVTEAELALDDNGRFLALRVRHFANLGAYVGSVGANLQTLNFARCFPEHVRHPFDRYRREVPVHQHRADLALSRRRPAGGELRARARDRRGRARDRHRPRQAAQEEPDPRQGDPLQDRGRHDLRLRRVPGRSSTRRSNSPTSTASRSGARSR